MEYQNTKLLEKLSKIDLICKSIDTIDISNYYELSSDNYLSEATYNQLEYCKDLIEKKMLELLDKKRKNPNRSYGFRNSKPINISNKLCDLINIEHGTKISYEQILSKIKNYLHKENLFFLDSDYLQKIKTDYHLRTIFNLPHTRLIINYSDIIEFVNEHLIR